MSISPSINSKETATQTDESTLTHLSPQKKTPCCQTKKTSQASISPTPLRNRKADFPKKENIAISTSPSKEDIQAIFKDLGKNPEANEKCQKLWAHILRTPDFDLGTDAPTKNPSLDSEAKEEPIPLELPHFFSIWEQTLAYCDDSTPKAIAFICQKFTDSTANEPSYLSELVGTYETSPFYNLTVSLLEYDFWKQTQHTKASGLIDRLVEETPHERKSELVLLSNRTPRNIQLIPEPPPGESRSAYAVTESAGGLATAVNAVCKAHEDKQPIWIGNCAHPGANLQAAQAEADDFGAKHDSSYQVVFAHLFHYLEVAGYYLREANTMLWPSLHHLEEQIPKKGYGATDREGQQAAHDYVRANIRFALEAACYSKAGSTIWVHDYHLFLVGTILRHLIEIKGRKVMWTSHIPFQPTAHFTEGPLKTRLLNSMLTYDRLTFHTAEDAEQFIQQCRHHINPSLEATTENQSIKTVHYENRRIEIRSKPISLDPRIVREKVTAQADLVRRLKERFQGKTVIFAIGRSDYTKGFPPFFKAIASWLKGKSKAFTSQIVIRVVVCANRQDIEAYQKEMKNIQGPAQQIIDEFGAFDTNDTSQNGVLEVSYESMPNEHVVAHLAVSDIVVAAPIIDGCNLISSEGIAAQTSDPTTNYQGKGLLIPIISRGAGIGKYLASQGYDKNAFLLLENPNDTEEYTNTLDRAYALCHPDKLDERRERFQRLSRFLEGDETTPGHTAETWANFMLDGFLSTETS